MDSVARNRECREQCHETTGGGTDPRLCVHGRLYVYFATIENQRYWQRASRLTHPFIYYRTRKS